MESSDDNLYSYCWLCYVSRQLMYCMCADKQFAQGTFFEDYHVVHFCKSYLSQHYSSYHVCDVFGSGFNLAAWRIT